MWRIFVILYPLTIISDFVLFHLSFSRFPLQEWKVTRLTFECDPEPYGKERDGAIIKMAKEFGVETIVRKSHTLYNLDRSVFKIWFIDLFSICNKHCLFCRQINSCVCPEWVWSGSMEKLWSSSVHWSSLTLLEAVFSLNQIQKVSLTFFLTRHTLKPETWTWTWRDMFHFFIFCVYFTFGHLNRISLPWVPWVLLHKLSSSLFCCMCYWSQDNGDEQQQPSSDL